MEPEHQERHEHKEFVFCLSCQQLQEIHHMHKVFQTGFRWIDGVNYPIGVCLSKMCINSIKKANENDPPEL